MEFLVLVGVGVLVGLSTVLFGLGGGLVTVPIVTIVNSSLGDDAVRVAVATSAVVMLVNASLATASTKWEVLRTLRGRTWLFVLLGAGGALGAFAARYAPDELLRWGFAAYVAVTVVDSLTRPGFFHPRVAEREPDRPVRPALRSVLGLPIGAIAAFLGVGGSVMTVPVMRRAGSTMSVATTLANPLTMAIAAPAAAVTLLALGSSPQVDGLVGFVDVHAAAALLVGAMPIIFVLRRRPPRIPEVLHAVGYLVLVTAAGVSVVFTG